MPKAVMGQDGSIRLPGEFLLRRRLLQGMEWWLDQRDVALILLPRLSDLRKLYVEPTTVCNLNCRFVQDRAMVVGWNGGVAPCYALSHNYSHLSIDGRRKQVTRYALGNIAQQSLLEIWTSEEYCRFRNEVRDFHFPSCPDCDLRESCDLREQNNGCWGWNPSCADCLWAQDIVRCP